MARTQYTQTQNIGKPNTLKLFGGKKTEGFIHDKWHNKGRRTLVLILITLTLEYLHPIWNVLIA
jgi:hypothetical protein